MSQCWQLLADVLLEGGRATSLGSGAARIPSWDLEGTWLQCKLCILCEHVPGDIPLHLQLSPRIVNSSSTLFYQPLAQPALWILLLSRVAKGWKGC